MILVCEGGGKVMMKCLHRIHEGFLGAREDDGAKG